MYVDDRRALEPLKPFNNMQMTSQRRSVAGSSIGGIVETQEVLDFCTEHGITPDTKVIAIDRINDAMRARLRRVACGIGM